MTNLAWIALGTFALVELTTRASLTRLASRELLRLFVLAELGSAWLLRRLNPPRFELMGDCHKCGECCKQIVGDPPGPVKRSAILLNLFIAFHKLTHNFTAVGRGERGEVIFSCGYLKTDGRCGVYRHRPYICRNYPVRPYFEAPSLIPGCGYAVAPREVARMQARPSLPIVNPGVTVHHPTRTHQGADEDGDFHWVDDTRL